MMGPLISRPDERLYRALTQLDDGEYWLVKPVCLDADSDGVSWTPGVRMGVKPGSWFHQTEVFGPVLGIMSARDLDEALALQNGTQYGLTGGIHTLDPAEVDYWAERVEVGNAYVNRGTTGAIVQRQSFGGWKGSAVGPGAKAGGPNYVAQFGTSGDPDGTVHDDTWLASAVISDELEWNANFSKEHDLANLGCETNAFRYRPLPSIAVRVAHDANEYDARRVRAAIDRCGTKIAAWSTSESAASFANKLQKLNVGRVRVVGSVEPELLEAARLANIHVADDPVTANGGVEMLHYLREQTISRTRHRFGNMFSVD